MFTDMLFEKYKLAYKIRMLSKIVIQLQEGEYQFIHQSYILGISPSCIRVEDTRTSSSFPYEININQIASSILLV
jgi:hypothetical protein